MARGRSLGYIIGMCVMLGSRLIDSGRRRRNKFLKIKELQTSLTHTAVNGLQEFQGIAWPEKDTYSSSNGKYCLFYDLKVLQKNRFQGRWARIQIFHERSFAPFYLIDPSGCILVDYAYVEFQVESRKTKWRDLPPDFAEKLLERIKKKKPDANPERFVIEENFLVHQSQIYVLGNFTSKPSSSTIQFINHNDVVHLTRHMDKKNYGGQEVQFKPQCYGTICGDITTPLLVANSSEAFVLKKIGSGNFIRMIAGALLIIVGGLVAVAQILSFFYKK